MSLNFSIDSILRHGNVEPPSSTLINSNKINQTSFLKKQFNHKQVNNYLLSKCASSAHSVNGLNTPNQLNEIASPFLYLNKVAANSTSVINLMESVQTNRTTSDSLNNSAFSIELNRLNQLTQFQNRLVPYLSKINSLYNDETLNSNIDKSNSNQSNNNSHFMNSNHNHKLTLENSTSSKEKESFFTKAANSTSALFNLNPSFNRTESQCSPFSEKSCEMLLNYEDSSDSNRMSQHSGNDVPINSNSSNANGKQLNNLNSSNNNNNLNKDAPLCTKCKLHGIRNQVKGHKKNCPKKDCICELCILTDYGKRLRGKKNKKSSAIVALSSQSVNFAPTNLFMMDTLNETNNLINSNLNDNSTLVIASTVTNLNNQPTTPNSSNSNSSCSNLSMSNTIAASLCNHQPLFSTLSTTQQLSLSSVNSNRISNHRLNNLHSDLNSLEKNALKDYMRVVINLLKEKLAQDGLNYEQEIRKLKFTVIYLLLNRFDKKELFTKFMTDA